MNNSRLHSKQEPRLVGGRLYSFLDLLGWEVICSICGSWQRLKSMTVDDCVDEAKAKGWGMNGNVHHCPFCRAKEAAEPTFADFYR